LDLFSPGNITGVWCDRANAGASGAGEHAHHFQSARPTPKLGTAPAAIDRRFCAALPPPVLAEVLRQLGRERAWVVHGLAEEDVGMDEISICGPTTIAELRGGGREENAASLKGILAGEITAAKRDLVVINAASGFVVAGLARDLNDGIALAREQIDSGRALAKLRALQNYQPKVSA
jgi:anthranilate phosphoribosyltransferase